MTRLGTTFAIALGTALLVMLIAVPVEARKIAKVHPIGTEYGDIDIDVWTGREEGAVYNAGDPVTIYFNADQDCYVTIYDIDTDGNVRILFPEYPDDGFIFGGVTYRLPDYYGHKSLYVTGPHGVEYINAVASLTPGAFRYQPRMRKYHLGVDPVSGDPFVAINSINQRIISSDNISATATTYFFVGNRVWYPRYMCRSCHGGAVMTVDPYMDPCPRYSIRVSGSYDYWWGYEYYPVRTHFVFGGPFWSIEVRTGPHYRRHHYKHIDIAYGYHNYYCPTPPRRPYRYTPIVTTRTVYREKDVRDYRTVTYNETRSRDGGRIRPEVVTRTRDDSRSRSSRDDGYSTSTSRSRDRSGTTGTYNGTSSTRDRSGTTDTYNGTSSTRDRSGTTDTYNGTSSTRDRSGTTDTYNGTSSTRDRSGTTDTYNGTSSARSRSTGAGTSGTESTTTRSRTWNTNGTTSTGTTGSESTTRSRTTTSGSSTSGTTSGTESTVRNRSWYNQGNTGGSTTGSSTNTDSPVRSGYDNNSSTGGSVNRSRSNYEGSSSSTSTWSTSPNNEPSTTIRNRQPEPAREQPTRVEPQPETRSRETVTPQREQERTPSRFETSTIRVPSAPSESIQSRSSTDAQSSGSDSRSRQQSSSSSSSTSSRTRTR